jgi:hypothetical protein
MTCAGFRAVSALLHRALSARTIHYHSLAPRRDTAN